jgi:hypothetical protein
VRETLLRLPTQYVVKLLTAVVAKFEVQMPVLSSVLISLSVLRL